MSELQATIGLEVHAELKTRTKMFCDSLNDPDEKHPNVNVCPVCLAHPGTLPVANKQAILDVIRVGLALGGKINEVTKFDRKNYFYPDLPKGYQISQYDQPLVLGGTLRNIRIRRVHLEEDTATLAHATGAALVDFNRSGVPLMELVTEPDFRSADEVADFARELQLILRYLGVSDANMEKGQMRIEANVSLSEKITGPSTDLGANFHDQNGWWKFGTYTELKNINSFKAVHDAVEYELRRQEEALKNGEKLVKETRGWNEAQQKTVSQRSKEEAHDYRYFPEPDLPPFETKEFEIDRLRDELPELPEAKRKRFRDEYGLSEKQLELVIAEPELANFFEEAMSELRELDAVIYKNHSSLILNYLTSDLRGLMNDANVDFDDLKFSPENLAHLVLLVAKGSVTSRQAKDIIAKMFETGADPEEIVKSGNIGVSSDIGEIEAVVMAVIAENEAAVHDYKKGKTASLQFLIGKAMAKLKGRAHPEMLADLFKRMLENDMSSH
jgi:aspartyl-tRNA(Asn)/glutamyl-tRNA(Gln) amidotransferase subunit B